MTQVEAVKHELIEHYIAMCEGGEAWKRQSWRSANDLAERFPREFGDLPELLTAEMQKRKSDE